MTDFIRYQQKHITSKRLNSPYMSGTKLGFISRPIKSADAFLPKYGVKRVCFEKMAAARKEPVKKLSRAKITSISLDGKALSEEIVIERIFREARGNFSLYFNSSSSDADVNMLEASVPFRGLLKRCFDHFFDLFSERVKGSFDKHALIQVRWYEFARQVLASRDVEEIVQAFRSRGKEIVSCVLESVLIAGFKFVVESQEASSGRIMVTRESSNITEDDVSLLKLGSAATLKLKKPLRQIALPLSKSKQSLKNMVIKEIDALEKLEDPGKTNIPSFLRSLDQGNLLVLKVELIPFLRVFTRLFGRVVNQNGYHSFGTKLFKVSLFRTKQNNTLLIL